jgi:hypothetical protein
MLLARSLPRLQQAKAPKLIADATDIRLRAERRWGELYQQPEVKAKGTRDQLNGRESSGGVRALPPEASSAPTLAEMGVTKTQSVKWQALAALSPEQFEAKAAAAKKKVEIIYKGACRLGREEGIDRPRGRFY